MRETLKHEILEFHSDTLLRVREACGLGAPGRVAEAVSLLRDWLTQEEHLLRKDFPDSYLENFLIMSKGSVEKSKQRLDLVCTMRTFAPQFFSKSDILKDFKALHDIAKGVVLPRLTDDHYRVGVLKLSGNCYPSFYQELFQILIIMSEYTKLHDCLKGFVYIVDLRDVNIMEFVTKVNLIELRNMVTLETKGYGVRIKSIHFVTPSNAVEVCMTMLKQVISAKITSRISVQKTFEELHQFVPKRILPQDLGGEERSIATLYDEWLALYSREEHIIHMREMQEARTDESRRRDADQLDPMFGLPGTFRALNLD